MSGSAYLDRMSIRGIRSFDPEPLETIEFFLPLTLIVGQNGSGKTTIIECLKYACCGLLPPNSKNGAFIHDPQLVMEKEVRGQVKLRVKRSNHTDLVATRNLSLTVTKTTRKFKTLEAHLQTRQDGERTSISSTVAELDTLFPVQIGASRAILDNVIFCHQEESLWPMSEPSVLKKRFDEIFEAEKYTKAIDNIKVMRKKHNEQLAQFKIHEQHAKEDKERGKKQQDRMALLSDEVDKLKVQRRKIDEQMQDAMQKSQTAFDKASEFVSRVEELKSKRAAVSSKEEIVSDLKSSMHAMEDSTQDLERMSEQYDERVQQYQAELESTTQEWHQYTVQIEKGRGQEGKLLSKNGGLKSEKDAFDAQVISREKLVKESARHHGVRGYDHDLDHDQILDFMDRIAKMAKDQNSALDRARIESDKSIRDVQSRLDQFRDQRTSVSQQRENTKQLIGSNDKKMAEQRRKAERVDVDEGRRAAVEGKLDDVNSKLSAAKNAQKTAEWHKLIPELESQASSMEGKTEYLQKEMVQAADQAGSAAELNRLKKVLKESRLRLDANKGAQSTRISALLGSDWTELNVEELYDSAMSTKARGLRDTEQQRDGLSREVEALDIKIKSAKDRLKAFSKERDAAKKSICDTMPDVDDPRKYPAEMQQMETARDDLAVTAGNVGEMAKFWKQIQTTLHDKNICWTCRRSFKPGEDLSKFQQRVQKSITDASKNAIAAELKELNEEFAEAKALSGTYERWVRLHVTDIPAVESELESLEPKHRELTDAIERKDRDVSEIQSANDEAESMSKAVRNIAQDALLAKTTQKEIDALTKKQADDKAGRSPDEINDEIQVVADQHRKTRSDLSKLQADRDRADDEVTRLEFEARDAKAEVQTVLSQLKEKGGITAQIAELSAANEECRSKLRSYDSDLEKVKPQIQQVESELEDLRRRHEAKEKGLRDEAASLTSTRDRLENANREIQRYLSKNGPAQLAQNEEALEEVREQVKQLEGSQKSLTQNINKLKEQQRNHEETKRRIIENLRYRKNLHDLDSLREDIEAMEAENAEADRQYWEDEGQKWGLRRNQLSTQQATMMGEMKSKDNEIDRLWKDFEVDGQNAPQKYKEANVRVEATKAVVEDLGRYGGALDKAVMRYHGLKMEQINRVIDELWRRTYQGTDVDTVLIRSESDGAGAKGNKSHNYRVVMIKQDAEMDMRGRCSAGQKVLACIIIRLALAECFGSNCGMIALDEPTTNLDVHNIKALAESLHSIIQQRKAQANFQLIVITHDEEFLRNMHALDHADDYFRVKRNINQKSVIRKERIQDLYQ